MVPAAADEWQVDPFSGVIKDGAIWGRGAVDMKNMDAMMLAIVRHWARNGIKPPRNIVLAFFAAERMNSLSFVFSLSVVMWLSRLITASRC